MKKLIAAAALALCASTSFGAIVNLSANPPSPNAGFNSGGYPYKPVYVTLGAGTYAVSEVGIAGGGMYDAYSVYAPSASNGAYTDSQWFVSIDDGKSSVASRASIGRYNTATDALAAYSALAPLTFNLATTTKVAFYINDSSNPYFLDDSGGISLNVRSVPEPATAGLVGMAAVALVATRRRTRASK